MGGGIGYWLFVWTQGDKTVTVTINCFIFNYNKHPSAFCPLYSSMFSIVHLHVEAGGISTPDSEYRQTTVTQDNFLH
jgi:hypothetical protein